MKSLLKVLLAGAAAVAATAPAHAVLIYYQGAFTNDLYKFDTDTATETLVGQMAGLSADSTGMAFAPNGTLYAFDRTSENLYTIDTGTAAASLVGNAGIQAEDFTVSLDGSTGYSSFNNTLYSVNLSTGAATQIAPLSTTMDGLTTAPVAVTVAGNNYAAGSVFGVDSHNIYAIDVGTGATTFLGGTIGADETLDFGPDGTLYGHGDDGNLYTIDLATLVATPLHTTASNLVFGMAVAPNVQGGVPEPATWALMIAGFGIAGFRIRARRKVPAFA